MSSGDLSTQAAPVRRPPFRFALGEKVLATWRPALLGIEGASLLVQGKLDFSPLRQHELPDPLSGFLVRRLSPECLPMGVAQLSGFQTYVREKEVSYRLALSGSMEAYLKKFSPKTRQNIQRAVRKFEQRQSGSDAWQLFTRPEEMAHFQREAAAISSQTYQHRLLNAGFSADEAFGARLRQLAEEHRAMGYLLLDAGRPIAFAWCTRQGDQVTYEAVGYLPDQGHHSPGTVLLYHIIEDLFSREGIRFLDFGVGEAQYKALFSTDKDEYITLYVFTPTWRNKLLIRGHWFMDSLNAWIGKRLDQMGLKTRIKRLMRRG